MYKYFTFLELIRTGTGESNVPHNLEHVENLVVLAQLLEEIREHYGSPIIVTSGFRVPIVNAIVGGVPNSYHLTGRAADIRPDIYPANDYKWRFQQLVDVIKCYNEELVEFIVDPKERYIHIAI